MVQLPNPKQLAGKLYSEVQENRIAKHLGGKVQANSGGTKFGGGDVHTKAFLIEAKTHVAESNSFTIQEEWIKKAKEQAFEQGKDYSAVAFAFDPKGPDYYIIDKDLMKFLITSLGGSL